MTPGRNAFGYIIPEFPGQTHIWMWREISHLREWGAHVRIYSTRRPSPRDRARHAFADDAERETTYLWPKPLGAVIADVGWALLTRPIGLARCIALGLTLPVEHGPAWRRVLPLLPAAIGLARRCRRDGVSRLHAQSAKNSAILCMMVRRLVGLPYSVVVNARLEEWGGALREKFGEAELVVTHARWLAEEIRRQFPRPDDYVLHASVGVDTHVWAPAPRPAADDFTIVSVGRLHVNKGFETLISAVRSLRDAGRRVNVRIIGAGPHEAALRQHIEDQGVADAVMLTGSLPEDRVRAALQAADAFALTSRDEALGVVFMEAMAVGLPVIGTTVGGIPELIEDGVNGFLVPVDDVPATVAAIGRLMDDGELHAAMAARALARAREKYDSRLGARRLLERFKMRPRGH